MSTVNDQINLENALNKLKSLRESEIGIGIVQVIAYGPLAIPALRALLLERESSGLFQVRCRAIDALSAFKAYDVLIEFLNDERAAPDPVERLGDDAVINYAAWAVARSRGENVFALLLRLAKRSCLSGVIGALGTFGRIEAVPALIAALEEDGSRGVAQYMLRRMGQAAYAELLATATHRLPSPDRESVSSLRRRRSSLMLLIDLGLSPGSWPQIRNSMFDDDAAIAVLASKLCLLYAPGERQEAIGRLMSLLPSADWLLRAEIERCLGVAAPSAARSLPAPKTLH
jgi:HEAT repeat protein